MLRAIVKELPYKLRNQIILEYTFRIRELDYLLETKPQKYQWLEDIELVKYLLLLGIFYRKVIDPILGTAEFTNRLKKLGIPGMSIGSTKLTSKSIREIKDLHKFEKILFKFNLSAKFFDVDSTEEFLDNVRELKLNEWDTYE